MRQPQMNVDQHRTQGFTLIELLVVIAIIGVLAALLIPSYAGAQKKPYNTAALQCGRAIIIAQTAHKAETGGYYSGGYTGLSEDVAEACAGLQVQNYFNGFVPGPTVTGNGVIGGGGTTYNFWVFHQKGSALYYTSTGDNLRLSQSRF